MADKKKKIGSALVVGAGVGGMQAALDLADAGIKAYLLDGKGSIGGRMVQLDKTFPTNDCAMCTIAPRLVTIDRHLNIELLVNSELLEVTGEPGNFKAKIRRRARYVDETKCTACGTCEEKCPAKVDSEFNGQLVKRKAIYTLFPQAVPNVPVVDKENCIYFIKGKCRACEIVCEPKAIDLDREEEIIEINVGSIIITPGYDLFNAAEKPQLGFGRYPNVMSSLQFERMLAAAGPFAGDVRRMSDKEHPHKLAFIQCIGSREKEADFCSAVCCMYATKEAIIMKEHHPETEITIFFIDIRAYGKGFESYYERAKQLGVKYVRCQPSSIKEVPATKDLIVRYQAEDGKMLEEKFNMVVLSCGMRPSEGAREVTGQMDIDVDKYGWCRTDLFTPVATSREGVFAAGTYTGPKDIPETVMQASSAASNVLGLLAEEKGSLLREKEYPEEKDTSGEEPRVGVLVCHCGKNIASVVNIEEAVEYARSLPGVVHAENAIFACSTDSGERIKQIIKEHDLNRIVIAACTPRTHEPLFQDTLREASLNPYLMEMANIRNQCSWVHMDKPELATEKSKELIKMATIKTKHLQPLYPGSVEVNRDALVIGGGMAGMTAALELAGQGFKTYLLEKSDKLGGSMWRQRFLSGGHDPEKKLKEIIEKVENNPLIEVYKGTKIEDFEGSAGNFKTRFKSGGKEFAKEHGAVILASGGGEYKPKEYLYGQNDNVITQLELEDKLASDKLDAKSVVMIQCVGSRNEEHPYCSRLCCNQAVKNAILIKEKNPATNVFVLYRDIRTYSLNESEYTRARALGVKFIRFEDNQNPEVTQEKGKLKVSVLDPMLDAKLNIPADYVVLSAGVVPGEGNDELAKLLKVPLTEDGFFQEAHIKLRPVDFSTEGIFLCGLAHSPKSVEESIIQASAAAARASGILSKPKMELEARVSEVVDANCDGCAYCVDPCPFDALTLIEYRKGNDVKKAVESDPAKCHGCGVCMATCPKKGITVRNFQMEQISEMVDAALGIV
jgi:heterodisulfide reductase subunit A